MKNGNGSNVSSVMGPVLRLRLSVFHTPGSTTASSRSNNRNPPWALRNEPGMIRVKLVAERPNGSAQRSIVPNRLRYVGASSTITGAPLRTELSTRTLTGYSRKRADYEPWPPAAAWDGQAAGGVSGDARNRSRGPSICWVAWSRYFGPAGWSKYLDQVAEHML